MELLTKNKKKGKKTESMVSLVSRQYMRGKNGTESLVGFFFQMS